MKHLYSLDNYSDSYKEFGNKVLSDSRNTLNKLGIKVFPENAVKNDNVDSFVVKNNDDKEKKPTKKTADEPTGNLEEVKLKHKKNDGNWIRESLPTSNDISSLSSSLKSQGATLLSQTVSHTQNTEDKGNLPNNSNENNDSYDEFDIRDVENDIDNINTLSNASDDEGAGNPLQTLFEKDLNDGFKTYNFLGTNFKITPDFSESNICAYSDNLYQKKQTSVVFGGTTNIFYKKSNNSTANVEYNAYAFGKHKLNKFTVGAGAMGTGKDNVNNIYISLGAMHNQSKIYGIIQKEITIIPGLPTQYHTNLNVGIGNSSGYLDPESYHDEDKLIEEISDIDNQAQNVENKESKIFDPEEVKNSDNSDNTIVNFIFEKTTNGYELGVKGGYIFKFTNENKNHYFILPYGQISNTSVESCNTNGETSEGAKFILGAHLGQTAELKNGWEIKTKGVIEASHTVSQRTSPNNYILGNVNFKARKNNFSGEVLFGGYYTRNNAFCACTELKAQYDLNKNVTLYLKGGFANYKFDDDNSNNDTKNSITQIAVGGHFNF